ncbi:MAG: response regulator [Defluviitaleaceae bacterium]|nr:response regulator [Defluviitaleaceae bacterium]
MNVASGEQEIIFIVDDSAIILEMVAAALGGEYIIYAAISGKMMFELLEEMTPSLILLDIMMPDIDGYAAIKMLKSNEKTENIPVVFLTAENDSESELRALREGAVDYIKKPFFLEVLKMRVDVQILLQKQKRELLAANEAKSAFIAVMSHEMRTPLNAILGLSEISLEDPGTNYYNLVNIKKAGTTLLSIISDILDVSKIESGKFDFIRTEYDAAHMISDATTQSILHRNEKDIDFVLTIGEDFPAKLFGDELRVKQVLNNLLSNAFKYTQKGSVELEITSTRENNTVLVGFSVKDTGIGIRSEELSHIFDDYMQADMTANRKIVGTGLGLSIAHRLCELMEGSLIVQSEYGKGSIFSVLIKQQLVSEEILTPEIIHSLQNLCYYEQMQSEVEKLPPLDLSCARILVVDDVDVNLEVAVGMLKRYGVKTDCVRSGPEAIDAVKNSDISYDIILMDHMMPGMDGIETTRHIREIESANDIPIIAFTANALVGNEEMFLRSGFQGYLSKPIDSFKLDTIIRKWVASDSTLFVAQPKQTIALDFDIESININRGVQKFGDIGIYLDVLRMFAQNVPQILQKAELGITDDTSEYITSVHGIRGSCYGICADETANLANILENAAKNEKYDVIHALNSDFIENVNKLLADISKVITYLEAQKQKAHADEPSPQLLDALLESCKRNDLNEIDKIIAELDSFEYAKGGELVTWIREAADSMDYADIIEKLTQI